METAHLWKLNEDILISADGLGGGNNQNKAFWNLVTPHNKLRFEIESVHLSLFRIGIGFLTIDIHPRFETLSDWFDFIHYFRFINRPKSVFLEIQRKINRDETVSYFPPIANSEGDHTPTIGVINSALLMAGNNPTKTDKWWDDVFVPGQLLPYTGLFLAGDVNEENARYIIYRARNFFHSSQDIHPSPEQLSLNQQGILNYADQQWFLFSLDGGGFVANNAPISVFFRETLPQHLKSQYFLIYILALHQRFALNTLSNEVAESWLVNPESLGEQRESSFQQIRDALLSFKARGYYTQLMQREHHHFYYCKWQETLQLARLYQDVCTQISDMYEFLMMQKSERIQQLAEAEEKRAEIIRRENEARERADRARSERLERQLALITWLIGLPLLGLTFQLSAWGENLKFAIDALLVSLLLGFLLYLLLRQIANRNAKD